MKQLATYNLQSTTSNWKSNSARPLSVVSCSSGFTLVEALVSLVLLTSALVPAFILATDALMLSSRIRNTLIASSLAQEGVEVVRAIRDANWFKPTYPLTTAFSEDLLGCAAGCRVAWDSISPVALSGVSTPLLLNESGLYQYAGGTESVFSRVITITAQSDVELVVKSEVTWNERSIPKSVVVESHLFDWIK